MAAAQGEAATAGRPSAPPCVGETAAGNGEEPGTACAVRDILHRVGDKWAIFVVDRLGHGTRRFTELHRGIDGITPRMLTVTLRGLERDGIVARTIYPVIPPRVEYELTPLGKTLLATIEQLVTWAVEHRPEIETAQGAYDTRDE